MTYISWSIEFAFYHCHRFKLFVYIKKWCRPGVFDPLQALALVISNIDVSIDSQRNITRYKYLFTCYENGFYSNIDVCWLCIMWGVVGLSSVCIPARDGLKMFLHCETTEEKSMDLTRNDPSHAKATLNHVFIKAGLKGNAVQVWYIHVPCEVYMILKFFKTL